MKKLLIHIGTGKTGTTSIQQSLLAAERKNLLGEVCYPEFLKSRWDFGNPHSILGYVYRPHAIPRIFNSKDRGGTLKALVPEFRRELEEVCRRCDNIILSNEYLAGLSRDEVKRLKKDLQAFGIEDFRVVIYVRHPADLYLSVTQQILKASYRLRDPRRYRYHFKRAIVIWGRIFDGRIVVRPFDRDQLHQNCVVRDFVRVASDYFSRDLGAVEPKTLNESLSAEACAVLQKYRRTYYPDAENVHMRDSNRLAQVLRRSAKTIVQTKARLRDEVGDIITRRHLEQLEWLREHHGIDFAPPAAVPRSDWTPSADLRVEDIMDCREDIVQELMLYALKRSPRSTTATGA